MPNSAASSYANSIDPAGGIQQPHAKPELSGHDRPINVKSDFNANQTATAQQSMTQQGSEQVAKTNLGLNQGPSMPGPDGKAVKTVTHIQGMENDGAKAIARLGTLNQKTTQQKYQGKIVVAPKTRDMLKGITARAALKGQLAARFQEARAEQRLAPSRQVGRSV